MTEIILKDDLEQDKIDALLSFLKSWNIKAELRITEKKKTKKTSEFSISKGIWSDYAISADELRNKAWNK